MKFTGHTPASQWMNSLQFWPLYELSPRDNLQSNDQLFTQDWLDWDNICGYSWYTEGVPDCINQLILLWLLPNFLLLEFVSLVGRLPLNWLNSSLLPKRMTSPQEANRSSSPGNYKTPLAAQWLAGTPIRWWHLNIFRNSARKRSCSHA